jgi:hypothetical protein
MHTFVLYEMPRSTGSIERLAVVSPARIDRLRHNIAKDAYVLPAFLNRGCRALKASLTDFLRG